MGIPLLFVATLQNCCYCFCEGGGWQYGSSEIYEIDLTQNNSSFFHLSVPMCQGNLTSSCMQLSNSKVYPLNYVISLFYCLHENLASLWGYCFIIVIIQWGFCIFFIWTVVGLHFFPRTS